MRANPLGPVRGTRGLFGLARVVSVLRGPFGVARVVRGATFLALAFSAVGATARAQPVAPPGAKTVQVNRAARDAWSPIMDVLKPSRSAVTVTEAQLQRLRELPLEAVWGALQNRKHVRSFEGGFQLTVPSPKLVGRAVTMRYLPVRPDLMEAVQTLAKEGDWDYQYNVRAGEDLKPGDVVVGELGGMVDRATFLGDVTGLGMKAAGAQGVIVDGGIRDLSEFFVMKDLPIYYRGAHASAMADQVGVEWNGPIRLRRDHRPSRRHHRRRRGRRARRAAASRRRRHQGLGKHRLHGELQARDDAKQEVSGARHLPDVEPRAREGVRGVEEDPPGRRRQAERRRLMRVRARRP